MSCIRLHAPIGREESRRTVLARLPPPFLFLIRAYAARSEDAERSKREALRARHGEDVALKVAQQNVPPALVKDERCLAVVARVLVGLGHDPRGGV